MAVRVAREADQDQWRDGLAKSADGDDMFWLAPDTVPTLGDWFRAGGRGLSSSGCGA